MDNLILAPIKKIDGKINLSGSKSISNRALLLASLADGVTFLRNLQVSEDVGYMLQALTDLGVRYQLSDDKTSCTVYGGVKKLNTQEPLSLFLGNAGTAMRPLVAALCMVSGTFILTGDKRMQERPIKPLVNALVDAGANITYLANDGFVPLKINANKLAAKKFTIDGSLSSQFVSALLMAAPICEQEVYIKVIGDLVSKPYIDITLHLMKQFGINIINENYRTFIIHANQKYTAVDNLLIEGDASSASYFLAAAAIKGGSVTVNGIGKDSIQGDVNFAKILEQMGAKVTLSHNWVKVSKGELSAIDIDANNIPDVAMTIATTALFAKGTTIIRNIYNWRLKETDRLAAMAAELRKIGAIIEEGDDYLMITPPKRLKYASIDTYNDHRMAMCFSLLALSDTSVTINDHRCCGKTFPDYFHQLAKLSVM